MALIVVVVIPIVWVSHLLIRWVPVIGGGSNSLGCSSDACTGDVPARRLRRARHVLLCTGGCPVPALIHVTAASPDSAGLHRCRGRCEGLLALPGAHRRGHDALSPPQERAGCAAGQAVQRGAAIGLGIMSNRVLLLNSVSTARLATCGTGRLNLDHSGPPRCAGLRARHCALSLLLLLL